MTASLRRLAFVLFATLLAVPALGAPPARAGGPDTLEGVYAFGDATFHGSTSALTLTQPIVGAAATPTGSGYWTVASDGGVFAFGDAHFHGSTGNIALTKPIVGMAPTPTGNGYWLVASDGGVFAFGDAHFRGSMGATKLTRPIVGMASTPTGNGYWLVASDGGVFAFGDAHFHGSLGALHLAAPIVGMASTPTGNGYWLVASDGGVFALGGAHFHGSLGGTTLGNPVTAMAARFSGNGYWLVQGDGTVTAFGDAHTFGNSPHSLIESVVSIMPTPSGNGYFLATGLGIPAAVQDQQRDGTATGTAPARLIQVREQAFPTFDRLVLLFDKHRPDYTVSYVPQFIAPGSGAVVPLTGNVFLHVVLHNVATFIAPIAHFPGLTTINEVDRLGVFEGSIDLGVGINSTNGNEQVGYRVIASSKSIFVDIAHPADFFGS
jgi:hypothetical protein